MNDLSRNLRQALRRLLRTPGFTIVAILTLGLGIGANTAIFTFVNQMLLRPLPVKDPDRLVALNNMRTNAEGHSSAAFSYLNYKDLRDRNAAIADLFAYAPNPVSLSYDGNNERIWGYIVSGNYFEVTGVPAFAGRMISSADDLAPGAHPVTVISYDSWQRRFGADPTAVGREVVVNGRAFTIIGVAPPDFVGTEVAFVSEMWFPLMMQSAIRPGREWMQARGFENLFVAARLKPGVAEAQAAGKFEASADELASEYPAQNAGKTITLSTVGLFGSMARGNLVSFSLILLALVALVLLLVCVNLANLCLARGAQRAREIAVLMTLGASRGRIVRQLLTESLLLSVAGGIAGVTLAAWLIQAATRFRPPIDLPLLPSLHMDATVLLFALVLSILTTVTFGLFPAWKSTGLSHRVRQSRSRTILVAAQVYLSCVLMISAGLVLRSLQRAEYVDIGMNPQNAVELAFDLTLQGYDRDRGAQFHREILERVRLLPDVVAAGAGSVVPPDLHMPSVRVRVEGTPATADAGLPRSFFAAITPGYFPALGIRLLGGRDFSDYDNSTSQRVAIVNEAFARRFLNGEDSGGAIGKRVGLSNLGDSWIEVVGVVRDGKYRSLSEDPSAAVFVPLAQNYTGLTKVVARTATNNGAILERIRREVLALDPYLPIFDAQTMSEHMRLPLFIARVVAVVLGSFGSLALILAALGVFGVVSFSVSRRTQEIGIRMALGAGRRDVVGLIVQQGMMPVIAGIAVALISALAMTRFLAEILFEVSATDPAIFLSIMALLGLVALVACYIPARRAVKVDPMVALRHG